VNQTLARTRRRASAAGYHLSWAVAQRLPERVVDPLLRQAADRTTRLGGPGVRRLQLNLARAAGTDDPAEIEDLARAAMRSYLRYWGEVFRLPRWSAADVRARVRTEDEHRLRAAYASGRGVVAALPHMGNWDLAGAWACAEQMPLMTVAERLRPAPVYDEFVRFREGLGMTVLPMTGGSPPLPVLRTYLEGGGLVCLLADRALASSGAEVELLGETAKMAVGPAFLAQQTGATLLPVTTAYAGEAMRIRFFEPVEHRPGTDGARAMTQTVADAFGTAIADDPVDWHMLQRVFVRDFDAARRR